MKASVQDPTYVRVHLVGLEAHAVTVSLKNELELPWLCFSAVSNFLIDYFTMLF